MNCILRVLSDQQACRCFFLFLSYNITTVELIDVVDSTYPSCIIVFTFAHCVTYLCILRLSTVARHKILEIVEVRHVSSRSCSRTSGK